MYILHFIFESKIYIFLTTMFYPVLSLWVSTCTKQLYNKIVKTSQLVYIHHFCASEPICTYIYCIFTVSVIMHTLLILKCWLLKYMPPVHQCVCFVHQAAVGQLVEGNGVVSEVIITLWNPSLKLQLTNFCCIYVCKARWALTQAWRKLPFTGRAFGMTRYVATWCLKI